MINIYKKEIAHCLNSHATWIEKENKIDHSALGLTCSDKDLNNNYLK